MLTESSYRKITDVSTLSSVKAEMQELIAVHGEDADILTDFINHDPALSLTVLRTVNSAYFGFPRFIKTIRQAINLIGFERVLNIANSTSEIPSREETNDIKGLNIRSLWEHSIATAVAASEIAKVVYELIEEDVFICGLLHDIGKIGLFQHFPNYVEKIVEKARSKHALFYDAEKELSIFDHTIIGSQIIKDWSLPETIKYVIKYHHKPFDSDRFQKHVLIVNLADVLARSLVIGNPGDVSIPKLTSAVLIELDLEMSALSKIFENVLKRCAGKVALYRYT